MSMFCNQCQEAARNVGCNIQGVCGKKSDVANLQDLLLYVLKGIGVYQEKLVPSSKTMAEADHFMVTSLFSTITNANFDRDYFVRKVKKGLALRDQLAKQWEILSAGNLENLPDAAVWKLNSDAEMEQKAESIGLLSIENEDIRSLRQILMLGIKGIAAYADHAMNLGYENQEIFQFMNRALAATIDDSIDVPPLINLVLECGKFGVDTMALLDKANTSTYGNPEISQVNIGVRQNPAILISGHDLRDMDDLLKQTEGTGVDIYTHSEMLPANYYPAFKKYPHLVGNYGNAWWKQNEEFEAFNGPVLMTTNCLVPPKESYKNRVYTTGEVGFQGLPHIANREPGKMKDFSAIIEHAKKCPPPRALEEGQLVGGFAHHQVFALADKVVEAVKSGAIRRFFVMAGCDGRHKSREYYAQFAEKLPRDTVILTAGCAKYRYNKLPLGDIGGIPRVLDAGQCNDSYSLAVIALKLKEVFNLDNVNDLPISFNIAWYEQKAVLVLLALLHLGFKKIHLGPTLPAFLTPNVTKVLVDNFNIAGITDVDQDLKLFLD